MLLRFEVTGKVDVFCDRCGNPLPLDLWDEFNVMVKLVEDPEIMNQEEEDPDVYYISRTESHLHLADWIYEFINLSIPVQRMCKEDEIGGPNCNPEVLAMLKKMDASARKRRKSRYGKDWKNSGTRNKYYRIINKLMSHAKSQKETLAATECKKKNALQGF